MKHLKYLIIVLFIVGCTKNKTDIDDQIVNLQGDLEISDFVWKGMNQYYYWQESVPDLSDDRKNDSKAYAQYIAENPNPKTFFESLLHEDDRFSCMVDDYIELENSFQGIVASNGLEFSLFRQTEGSNDLVGWVKYVHENSDAAEKNIQRGNLFTRVNGQKLTASNYNSLLFGDDLTYTLGMANYDDGNYTLNGQSIALTKEEDFQKNPIYRQEIIVKNDQRIGYLMFNQFASNFNEALNEAFAEFQAEAIDELVLDLRYNRGGSIATCTYLASLITGQFDGQIFAKQVWNSKLMEYWEDKGVENLYNRFTNQIKGGSTLNSLRLNRVYIITTGETASASELLINGLRSYIDVIQIGDTTVGKNVGSITIYDYIDNDGTKNPNHTYAIQPIVLAIANNDDFADYTDGLTPDVLLKEDRKNAGVLGSEIETLLAEALTQITGTETTKRITPDTDVLGPMIIDPEMAKEQRLIIDTYSGSLPPKESSENLQ